VPADAIFFDLEDSVAPAAKERARGLVVEALNRFEYAGKRRSVRINACDTRWCYEDVIEVVSGAGARLDSLVVPKVEDVSHVHFLDLLLTQLEARLGLERAIGLELQIESPKGLDQAATLAGASARNQSLIFGPGDLAAGLKMPTLTIGEARPDQPGDIWPYYMARVLVAARAHGLMAVDGPYARVQDLDGLRVLAGRAAGLGFDGKWALHPDQVEILNQAFSPSQADLERAGAILEAYRRATEEDGEGAVRLGDEMIDEASRKMAEVMIERSRP
jgi:citrate lyase subunit beta/citryl-CoA lyase